MKVPSALLLSLASACDVPDRTLPPRGADAGLVVAATDQSQAANIGVISGDGRQESESVLSSGSAHSSLASAIGGDIAFPSMPSADATVAILDRYPSSVITWLDVSTAGVRAQLSVATGFAANPHDYVPVSDVKAYVTRFDSNPNPGQQPFDAGGDLLIVDPSFPKIVKRVDIAAALPAEAGYFVHPDRARMVDDLLYVVVPFYDSRHYSGPAYLVAVNPADERVAEHLLLDGLSGCSGLDVSPHHTSLAIACSGSWHGQSLSDPQSSAIIGVSLGPPLTETWRVAAPAADGRPFAFAVSFIDERRVIAARFGDLGPPRRNDSIELIDVETGTITTMLTSTQPVSLGIGPCLAELGPCFATDASRKQVVRFDFDPNTDYSRRAFDWHDPVGLPARAIARFNAGSSE